MLKPTVRFFRLFLLSVALVSCRSNALVQSSNPPLPLASSTPTLNARNGVGSFFVKAQRRTYLLYSPKSYRADRPIPLVVAFHGYGSQGKDLAQGSGLSEVAERQGFLVVYPDGLERRWQTGGSLFDPGDGDSAFVFALIRQIAQIRTVDANQVYAVGVSNGGFLVQSLACQDTARPRIAAFATVASTLLKPLQSDCPAKAPVPMLMINGTADQKIPWQGGLRPYGSLLGVPDTVSFWSRRNGCSTAPSLKLNPTEQVAIERYVNCKGGGEVELVALKGVGHLWPRGGGGRGSLINASQEIWNFFKRNPAR